MKGNIEFPKELWGNVSISAKDLVLKMTEKDQRKRLSAEEALSHMWFEIEESCIAGELSKVLENMKKYNTE